MRELNESNFISSYENTSKGSFSVISMIMGEEIQEIQVEQINKNSFPGILKFDVQHKNNVTYLYYNITSKIGLEQFLLRRRLKKDEFITIIQSIAKIILKSQNFLLYDKNMVMDKKHIYINASTMEVFVTYLPVFTGADIVEDYKNFVLDLITKAANIDEGSSDNYLQRILNDLKSEQFNINCFDKLLNEIKLSKEINSISSPKPQFKQNTEIGQQKVVSNAVVNKTKKKSEYKTSSIIIVAIIQIVIFTFIAFCIVAKAFSQLKDPVSTYAGIGIVVVGIDFLLLRTLLNKKDVGAKSTEFRRQEVNLLKKEILCIPKKHETPEYLQKENINDTVVLGFKTTKGALLKGFNDGSSEEVKIVKNNFLIGRFKPQVDFLLQSKFVSKVHSEIINREGNYFIKDINSQNGTFINTLRIDSNKEYEIENGDKIAFADSEYLFVIEV